MADHTAPHAPEAITDPDNPELTEADFARARPFAEVFPEIIKDWENKGGRPRAEAPKVVVGLRLAADLAQAIKAKGRGYNARVEAILRQALSDGRL